MADPTRMLDDPSTPGELARLVKALDGPKPYSEAAHARIGSKVAATVASPPAAAVASKAASLKLVAISGAIVAGGAVALFMAFGRSSPPEAPREARPVPAVAAPTTPPKTDPVAHSPEVVEPATKPKTQERTPPRPSARDDLAVEETLLEQARKAPPPRALALLREHERRFPSGLLTAERLYLSAKAHAESGNQTAARRYAAELERRFPASSYVARLRAILGETPADKSQ